METRATMMAKPKIVGERLALARRARGLTQQQAAEALGVARTTITAMEKGDRRPQAAELFTLARLYGRQLGDLVRPLREGEAPGFVVQFRAAMAGESAAAESKRAQDIQCFESFCRWYVELEQMLDAPLPMRYPEEYEIAGTNPERAAEAVATAERNRLGLGDGPIGDLWSLLEGDVGLRIFGFPMHDARIAGMFVASADLGGCVAVNANHPHERQRWTLAHEYWHFLTNRFRAEISVLRSGRVPASERAADAFTRHFLMPASGLTRRFLNVKQARNGPITPTDVMTLAHLYGVSTQAMTLRLEELDLLKPGTWDSLKAKGFKPEEARKLVALPEREAPRAALPFRYETLAARAFADALISEGQLARMLDTDRISAVLLANERSRDEQATEPGAWRQVPIDLGRALIDVG
jgi:Zn-dependent peptidase ImmA (M78 family)/transcriptional regulator with XRE-family HTH domain